MPAAAAADIGFFVQGVWAAMAVSHSASAEPSLESLVSGGGILSSSLRSGTLKGLGRMRRRPAKPILLLRASAEKHERAQRQTQREVNRVRGAVIVGALKMSSTAKETYII